MNTKIVMTTDFISEVNGVIKERKINDYQFTDNPNELIPLIQLYELCKGPVSFGGASMLIESVLDNFNKAHFGNDDKIEKGKDTIEITTSEVSTSFFKMQTVIMLLINVFESVKHIDSVQSSIKSKM